MYCAYICTLMLCIGTALAVLYNGEAPRQKVETVVGELPQQQQQRQHELQQQKQRVDQRTLPGYEYTVPQKAYTGYRYTAPTPAATAAETTTSTTTVRPTTTVAPTQSAAIGYIYNKPLAENYNRHAYFHTPHYQQSQQTGALAVSSDADVRQQLALDGAPSYYVPQAEVVNSGKQPDFFVPRFGTGAAEAQQTLAAREPSGHNYARPASSAESAVDTSATYQQAFQQFTDYLIWQRAQSKQQQTKILTQTKEKQQQHTVPYATQGYESQTLPQINFPYAHSQYGSPTTPSGSLNQAAPQAATATFVAQNYEPAAAAPAVTEATNSLAPAPTLIEGRPLRPLSNGELLSGERFISKDNSIEYYMEMPSESFELPTYSTMEMSPSHELSSSRDQGASQSYAPSNVESTAQQSTEQWFPNNVAPANAPYFYEPAKQFAQTAQHPLRLPQQSQQQQRDTPTLQAYVIQEQSNAAAAQQAELLAEPQQQAQQLVSDKRFVQTFVQPPTEATKTQTPQPSAAWFAEIPQWPQNVALQVQEQQQLQPQQQQPLYNRVVKPLAQQAFALGQSQSQSIPTQQPQKLQQQHELQQQHQLQQQPQSERQNYYSKAQSSNHPHPHPQKLPTTSATTLEHNSQRLPQPTQPTTPTANSNTFFNIGSSQFRRPHSSYGVPLESNTSNGYNYQRPVGQ